MNGSKEETALDTVLQVSIPQTRINLKDCCEMTYENLGKSNRLKTSNFCPSRSHNGDRRGHGEVRLPLQEMEAIVMGNRESCLSSDQRP